MSIKYNPVVTGNDLEVYLDRIDFLIDEYIDMLPDKDMIYKDRVFTGLIANISDKCKFNRDIQTFDSIDFLYNIWKKYRSICYRFNQDVILEEFCLFINMSTRTLYHWMEDDRRKDDFCIELNCARGRAIEKMQEECKLCRYKGAARGNVGSIFLCKAVDHLVETAPAQISEIDRHEKLSLEAAKKDFVVHEIGKNPDD